MSARISIFSDAHTPVLDDVSRVLARRGLRPRSVSARCYGGVATLVLEHDQADPAEASAILDEVKALANVRNAEFEILA